MFQPWGSCKLLRQKVGRWPVAGRGIAQDRGEKLDIVNFMNFAGRLPPFGRLNSPSATPHRFTK
jgi:hypothetical protein